MTRRRSLIQKLGASVAGAGLLTDSAAAEPGSQQSAGEQTTGSGQSDTPPAERDVMIGRSTQFDPYTISTDEPSILHSRWDFQAVPPIPANTYQLDILVSAKHARYPETKTTDVERDNVTKDWEYRDESPVGPAHHWQAELWVVDVLGGEAMVDVEITPDDSGDIRAKTGTF